jgi:hypothetical protein
MNRFQNQSWIVRGERLNPCDYRDNDPDVGVMFEMEFNNREHAAQVLAHGEKTFAGNPCWRWSMSFILNNDIEYAIEDINSLAREFSNEANKDNQS